MAIAFDAKVEAMYTGANTSTHSHTCTGSNLILIVDVSQYSNATTGVTGITYNSVAMTQISGSPVINASSHCRTWRYYLLAPATGANNVVITYGGAPWYYCYTSRSYTGVDQTTPFGTHATATGTTGSPTVNVSSATGELVVDVCSAFQAITVGSGQTQRSNTNNTDVNMRIGTSDEAGGTTVTMSWTGSGEWAIIGSPLKPVSGAAFIAAPNRRQIQAINRASSW